MFGVRIKVITEAICSDFDGSGITALGKSHT